jgi:hypothetical protein
LNYFARSRLVKSLLVTLSLAAVPVTALHAAELSEKDRAAATSTLDPTLDCSALDTELLNVWLLRSIAKQEKANQMLFSAGQSTMGKVLLAGWHRLTFSADPALPLQAPLPAIDQTRSYPELIRLLENRLLVLLELKGAGSCATETRVTRRDDLTSLSAFEQLDADLAAKHISKHKFEKEQQKLFDTLRREGLMAGSRGSDLERDSGNLSSTR